MRVDWHNLKWAILISKTIPARQPGPPVTQGHPALTPTLQGQPLWLPDVPANLAWGAHKGRPYSPTWDTAVIRVAWDGPRWISPGCFSQAVRLIHWKQAY